MCTWNCLGHARRSGSIMNMGKWWSASWCRDCRRADVGMAEKAGMYCDQVLRSVPKGHAHGGQIKRDEEWKNERDQIYYDMWGHPHSPVDD